MADTYEWWISEARKCAEDGHWSAAAAAYSQAVKHSLSSRQRLIAEALLADAEASRAWTDGKP